MAGRIGLGRRGGRVVVVVATAVYAAGLMIAGAAPGQTFGGSCNGRLSSVGYDASHEHGPVLINGTDTADVIIGSKGDDTIYAGDGDDVVCGGRGADDVHGDEGNDAVFGEKGDDTLHGNADDDLIYGGKGNDNITGDDGEDVLYGNEDHDILSGVDPTDDPGSEDKIEGGDGRNLCFVDAADETDDCHF